MATFPSPNMFSTVPEGPYPPIIKKVKSIDPPPPAYAASRTLHIYSDSSWSSRNVTIADADRSHPLYTLTKNSGGFFSSKPHMTVTSAQTSTVIGAATFHSMSRKVDLDLHGKPVLFEPEGMWTRSYSYASPAFGYDRLKWKCKGWGSDLVLVNSNKEWIAKFDAAVWAMKKMGRLEVGDGGIAGAALDEIVVSGLTMIEIERRRNASASAGANAAGA
ncbi:MAG: hypothetical protein Q9203_007417, partial [Teloschistes exilis]